MTLYQEWTLKYEGDGFYSIKANNCEKYVSLQTPMPINGVSIVLSSTLNDASLWRIVQTTQGAYSFLSKYGHHDKYSICSQQSNIDGQNLYQYIYNDDCSYYDEWYITKKDSLYSPNAGIVLNENYTIYNIVSSHYLYSFNNNISTSIDKHSWLIDSQYPQSSYFQSRLKNEAGLCITFEGTNVGLNNDSKQYLMIKRFNAKPYDGTYVIIYNNMFLYENPSTNEITLTPSFSPSCLWSFKTTEDKTANFFYFTNFTEGAYSNVSASLISKNYTVIPQPDKTASDAFSCLPYTDIFIFRGHGGSGAISFGSTSLNTYGGDYSITKYGNTQLSKVDMAYYLGCSTGIKPRDYPDLLTTSYNHGAHFAIGTYDTVYTHNGNYFIEKLFEYLNQDYNLKDAILMTQTSFPSESVYLPSYNIYQQYYPIILVHPIFWCLSKKKG